MSSLAPCLGSRAARRIEAPDARADGRRRTVLLSRERVEIARSVDGVFMRIALKPGAYRGVLLRVAGLDEAGFRYEIHLIHQDPEFNVALAQSYDQSEAQTAWSRWARFVGLPTLAERIEGIYEPARPTAPSPRPGGSRSPASPAWRRRPPPAISDAAQGRPAGRLRPCRLRTRTLSRLAPRRLKAALAPRDHRG